MADKLKRASISITTKQKGYKQIAVCWCEIERNWLQICGAEVGILLRHFTKCPASSSAYYFSYLRRAGRRRVCSAQFPVTPVCGPAFTSFRQSFRRRISIPASTQSFVCVCRYVPAGSRNYIDVLVTGATVRADCQFRFLGSRGSAFAVGATV